MGHAGNALIGDKDVARAVGIDVVGHQDVAEVTGIAVAAHVVARGALTADPGALALDGVLRATVVRVVACAVDVEAVAMLCVELCQLEGASVAIIDEDIVLRGCLDGEVAQVVGRRTVVAAGTDAVGVGLIDNRNPGTRSCAFAILN